MLIGRALVGAVAAAIAMFILGFLFFATPLSAIGSRTVGDAPAAQVQAALAQNLPATGTYFVPSADTPAQTTLYGRGPVATIHYNSQGFAHGDAATMIGGFLHMLVVAFLMAAGLGILSRYVPAFGERVRLLVLGVLGAMIWVHLGRPIWFHHDWGFAIYSFVADSVSLVVAGIIILKLLPSPASAARDHAGTAGEAPEPRDPYSS
jgi:hypothetical protein